MQWYFFQILITLISLINVEPTLTNFEKFHPPQKKIPPPRLLISLLKCLILLQNLMTIFLTIILSYKTLFYHKNWCLLPPPHLVIFHFWHPSTFIPGSTFIREMRVHIYYPKKPTFLTLGNLRMASKGNAAHPAQQASIWRRRMVKLYNLQSFWYAIWMTSSSLSWKTGL